MDFYDHVSVFSVIGIKNLADAFIRCQHNVFSIFITVDDVNALTAYVHDYKAP